MATKIGQKGSDVYTSEGIDNSLVALSALLVRGVDRGCVRNGVASVISDGDLENLAVLAFQTRDIRGGKGERDASKHIFEAMLSNPDTYRLTTELLDLLPEYGCWQDLLKMREVASRPVYNIVKAQFEKDEKALALTVAGEKPAISLLAKWMPREGQDGAYNMAMLLVPGEMLHASRMKLYRKRVAALNKALQTVEIKMCARDWDEIVPSTVPGRAVKKYVKAFLNEQVAKHKGAKAPPKGTLRCPGDPVRMACREHFQQHFSRAAKGEVVAKGADTLFPHEVVKKAFTLMNDAKRGPIPCYEHFRDDSDSDCERCSEAKVPPPSTDGERDHLRGVWRAMVDVAKAGGGLGRSLAMSDFSGSMRSSETNGDTPFWVSMAIGLLISEVTTEEFKNTFMTFDSKPKLRKVAEGDLFEKLGSFNPDTISQGTSTDFQKAMDLVLAQCKASRVKPGQEPENLIVLTDMAWDQACASDMSSPYTDNSYRNVVKTQGWQTHVEMIREAFKRAGEDMWGEGQGWKMPTIVIWNIAATCQDFHARGETEGVVMLSGWSPSLFKVLQNQGVVQMTPFKALMIQLEDKRYDPVRERVRAFQRARDMEAVD